MKKFFALVAALLLIATASPAAFAASSSSSKSASASAQMVKLVNRERQRYGRSSLQVDAKLTKAAQAKANEMVAKRYLSHTSPAYGNLQSLLKKFNIRYTAAGENVAYYGSVQRAHVGLMASSGHRNNILNARYNKVGIGVAFDQYGYVRICQLFTRS